MSEVPLLEGGSISEKGAIALALAIAAAAALVQYIMMKYKMNIDSNDMLSDNMQE